MNTKNPRPIPFGVIAALAAAGGSVAAPAFATEYVWSGGEFESARATGRRNYRAARDPARDYV